MQKHRLSLAVTTALAFALLVTTNKRSSGFERPPSKEMLKGRLECYAAGEGVVQDHVQAVSWYRKAAAQGNAKAHCSIGNSYLKGKGVTADKVEAYAYYGLAAIICESAPASGIDRLIGERARANISILEKEMSADQIAAGKRRSKELQKELNAMNTGK
jgi:hypothetical protein